MGQIIEQDSLNKTFRKEVLTNRLSKVNENCPNSELIEVKEIKLIPSRVFFLASCPGIRLEPKSEGVLYSLDPICEKCVFNSPYNAEFTQDSDKPIIFRDYKNHLT